MTYIDHDPSDIFRQLLVDLGLGTLPEDDGAWPIFDQAEPESPDNCITIFDTEGRTHGRIMATGQLVEHYGIQIRVRSNRRNDGKAKVRAIEYAVDRSIRLNTVSLAEDTGTATANYTVWSFNRTTQVLPLGFESPTSKRMLWTINGTLSVTAQQ